MRSRPHGLVLVLDELSEFLRSKPDAPRFAEDVRFLQFVGEWAQDRRALVVAAMQEAIEHTGDLEYDHYRKLKDRYPLRFRLTPAHVRDLVARHVLVRKPGFEEDAARLVRRLADALPDAPRDLGGLADICPIHPATLDLLEEVRDRFSQTRGVVDFVVRRLGGDPARGIEPFVDREWGELLTADAIVDHFADVLEVQAEFLPVSQKLLPWYRRHLPELFDTDALRGLAERLLKLLVVAWLSPARGGLTADEAAYWLLFAPSRIDPARNREIVGRTLDRLAAEGRYVRREGERWLLDLRDDGAADLERLLHRELAQLPSDDLVLERLGEALVAAPGTPPAFHPFGLARDAWSPRVVRWRFHDRHWKLWVGDGEPTLPDTCGLGLRLPWGRGAAAVACPTVIPAHLEVGPAARELYTLLRLRERPLGPRTAELVDRRIAERRDVFAANVREAYARAEIATEAGVLERAPALDPGDTLDRWLDALGIWALRRRYPAFERHAPAHGPLPQEAYREFMRHAAEHELGAAEAPSWVGIIREAYLVPMGLLRREGRGYAVPARLDQNELVRLLSPLVEHAVDVGVVYEHLAQPVYGLVPDQVHLLLAFLLVCGEIDILKDDRSYRTAFETLPTPRQYDRIVPGRSLGAERLAALERLAQALRVPVPQHWTVQAQRRAVRALRETLRGFAERLRPLRPRLGEGSDAAGRLDGFLAGCAALDAVEDELTAWERFVAAVESVTGFVARLDEVLKMPERLDRRASELRRFAHLLGQPGAEALAGELGAVPAADAGPAADAWLERAGRALTAHQADYRRAHDAFWTAADGRPAWSWKPPAVASSRHAAVGEELRRLGEARERAARLRCRGLSNLDYQIRCACGFDGARAAVTEPLDGFEAARAGLEDALRAFFAREDVRDRVRSWVEQGVERSAGTDAYLAGDAPWPDPANLRAFDEHLAGVDVIHREPVDRVVALLTERTWEPEALSRAFAALVRDLGADRIRFEAPVPRDADEVAAWCVERALRHGAPLPRGVGDTSPVAVRIEPAWVGATALADLEGLGLDDRCVERILGLLVDGRVAPGRQRSPLVAAAVELIEPSSPRDPEALAALAERLYARHHLLARIAPERARDRLEALACAPLDPAPPPLPELLASWPDAQRLVIDGFGLPLLRAIREALPELLAGWRPRPAAFGLAPPRSTTDRFYRDLLDREAGGRMRKVDVVDELLHRRALGFADLCRVAVAELHAALAPVRRDLDRSLPLVVFGDHGFRLAPDGRGWVHGGASTLERVVPVVLLEAGGR
jgi:hypothetical protein